MRAWLARGCVLAILVPTVSACAYHSIIPAAQADTPRLKANVGAYEEVLQEALDLQRHYQKRLNMLDATNTLGRVLGFVTAGFAAGSKGSDGVIDDVLPFTAVATVVLEAVNRGFQIDQRRDIYGRASAVIDCVVQATTWDAASSDGLSQPGRQARAASLRRALYSIHASVQVELSEAQLDESDDEPDVTNDEAPTRWERDVGRCLSRLVTLVEG